MTYTVAAGLIVTDDGRTSIPLDESNAEYRAYLAAENKTHAETLAASATLATAATATETTARNTLNNRVRTARTKLLALGLTRAEFRALFPDPDPND